MQELLDKLQSLHNLSPEQSKGVLNTIKNYIVEKFPMVGGMVDNLFGEDGKGNTGSTGNTGGFGDIGDKLGGMFGK